MKITEKTVVTVSFVVTDMTEKVVGRTEEPVVVLMGSHYLVPGLEQALYDHAKGDEFTIKLSAKDSYGETDPSLVQTIDRAMFGNFPIEVGNVFEADTNAGPRAVVVKEVHEDKVIVDGNHPLSGQELNFFVTVDDVREATEDEIAHGHAHKDGVCPSEAHSCGCGGGGCGCHGHHGHHDGGCGCHDELEDELSEHAGHGCGCGGGCSCGH